MPASLVSYWSAWNEEDLDAVRAHLAAAVTKEVEWNDPRDSFVGIDALETFWLATTSEPLPGTSEPETLRSWTD